MTEEKPWDKKWWVWAIVVSVAGGVVSASSGGDTPAAGAEIGTISVSGNAP